MEPDQRILEGIVTTINVEGSINVAPMGPIVDASMQTALFRPYQTSTTYQNLKRTGQGVLHVTDDVQLFARAAVKQLSEPPEMLPCPAVDGMILQAACRWYAFEVVSLDDSQPRTEIHVRMIASGRLRDFFGFNRAKHAVIEAAILATRVNFLPAAEIRCDLQRIQPWVEKTGAAEEREAFAFLYDYIHQRLGEQE